MAGAASCDSAVRPGARTAVWGSGSAWVIGPPARIIDPEESGDAGFFRIRGALRLPDGRVAVAEDGNRQLRVFSPAGESLATVGGEGSGPEEFRVIHSAWLVGDTIVTSDPALSRLVYWNGDGRLLRALRTDVGRLLLDGEYAQGGFLGLYPGDLMRRGVPAGDTFVDTLVAYHVNDSATGQREILRAPSAVFYAMAVPGGGVGYTGIPYMPQGLVAIGSDHFYYGFGDRWAILRLSPEGEVVDSLRRPPADRPGRIDLKEKWIERRLENPRPGEGERARAVFERWPFPDRLPAFDRLYADDLDHLWVRHPHGPDADSTVWSVFSPAGDWLGDLSLAGRYRLGHVGEDFLVGVTTDALGVERVALHGLDRQ